MRRLPRGTYALMVSLLSATATVIGVVVLTQFPSVTEVIGVALVVVGVALHRDALRDTGDGTGQGTATTGAVRTADQA